MGSGSPRIVALGASLGGPDAVGKLLATLEPDVPGIVATVHIPVDGAPPLAAVLGRATRLEVVVATEGLDVRPGRVCLAPGHRHLEVRGAPDRGFTCKLVDAPPVHYVRPAVDPMFFSVARRAGAAGVGVVLTGLGHDGGQGLLAMREAGALTVAQDRASSVAWFMPRHAIQLGAADEVLSLLEIREKLSRLRAEPEEAPRRASSGA